MRYRDKKNFKYNRKRIQKINIQIERLLRKRFILSNEIGEYKRDHKIPVLDEEQEETIIKSINHDIHYSYIKSIFYKILEQSKLEQHRIKFDSVILIGMPGCGKSAFAKTIAQELNIPYIDTDRAIVTREKKSIKEIFKIKGEKYFRNVEKRVVRDLSRGYVISTGGGTVLDPENVEQLKKIGKIIYIKRDSEDLIPLNFENRPLAKNKKEWEELFKQRKEIYESVADYTVYNKGEFKETKKNIIKLVAKIMR